MRSGGGSAEQPNSQVCLEWITSLAKAKRLAPSYVSGILRLTLLAPEIVEAILDGRQRAELQLDDLMEGLPLEWEGQRSALDG